jgi:predicted ester cyclase
MTDQDRAGVDLVALLALWESSPTERQDPVGDFAELYADPVLVNGTPVPVADLVARATALNRAFSDPETEVLDVVTEGSKVAFAFRRTATHVGTWRTPLGDVPATGKRLTLMGLDILTVESGRVTTIWVLADDLAVLLGAAGLRV